ncbi:MAG: SDR family oxidoreductase [Myxococcota bacterium]
MPKAPRVVVTGANGAVGAALARIFKKNRYQVILMAHDRTAIDALADDIGAHAVRIDVGDPASVEAAFMAAGPVDVLINSATISRPGPLMQTDVRVWEEHLRVNLTGAFLCSLKVLPGMISRRRGRIINLAGLAGALIFPGLAAYDASTAGIVGLTRSLAAEVSEHGIRVNALRPGTADAPVSASLEEAIEPRADEDVEDLVADLLELSGQPAPVDAERIAAAVFALATDPGADINGQILDLDDQRLA